MNFLFFLAFAVTVVISSLFVVLSPNPMTSAVALLVALVGVSGLFALANSGFLAVVQILVYAGAVVTLFLFVVMLLNLSPGDFEHLGINWQRTLGVLISGSLLSLIVSTFQATRPSVLDVSLPTITISQLSQVLFKRLALPFEMTSILLLASVVGVIALTKKEKP